MAVSLCSVEASAPISSAGEFTAAFLERNAGTLNVLWWPETVAYFSDVTASGGQRATRVIQLDDGVAYEAYPWLQEYLYTSCGQVWGYDMVSDHVGPLDDEDVEFATRHGTMGTMVMGALGATVLPIRVGWSDGGVTFSAVTLGMERAIQVIEDARERTREEYQVVVNLSLGFWKSPGMVWHLERHWEDHHGATRLFPMFVDEWSAQIEEAGFEPAAISYLELLSDGDLLEVATDWLFHAIYVEGTLTEELEPAPGGGAWRGVTAMREQGWMVLGAAGNVSSHGVYPARVADAEAIVEIRFTEHGPVCPLPQDDWAQLVVPGNLAIYNPDEDDWLEQEGSSISTNVASAVYAKVWTVAPGITDVELNAIILGTAEPLTCMCPRSEVRFEKRFIMPYRAIRVAAVYAHIKRAVLACETGDIGFRELQERVLTALHDLEDAPSFADVGAYEEIFPGDATEEMRSLERIREILIEKSMEMVPADRLEEALSVGVSGDVTTGHGARASDA